MAADVGQDRQCAGGDDGAPDRESIQPVGEVNRVARTDNHYHDERDERDECRKPEVRFIDQGSDNQVRTELLEEGNQQPGRVQAMGLHRDQSDCNTNASKDLEQQLATSGQAQVTAVNSFEVVVGKTDAGEGASREHRDPNEQVGQVRPEQRGYNDRDGNQQTAHGRSAGFFLVGFGTFLANVLPDLELAQAIND